MNKIFRIWDGKKYHFPFASKEESNHYLQFGSEHFWLFGGDGKMITSSEVGGVCEQSIDFLDVDNNELFDGDVINLGNEDGFKELRFLVCFENFTWVAKCIIDGLNHSFYSIKCNDWKVKRIGNIRNDWKRKWMGYKVRTIVGKQDKDYHKKRKGSIGTVLQMGVSLSKPCYWIRFSDKHEEWYYEDELDSV